MCVLRVMAMISQKAKDGRQGETRKQTEFCHIQVAGTWLACTTWSTLTNPSLMSATCNFATFDFCSSKHQQM